MALTALFLIHSVRSAPVFPLDRVAILRKSTDDAMGDLSAKTLRISNLSSSEGGEMYTSLSRRPDH